MPSSTQDMSEKVALITGAARRIGAVIARTLHSEGMNLILHYRHSKQDAHALQIELNAIRKDSVVLIQSDLLQTEKLSAMVKQAAQIWGRLDVLVNNASTFYPTPIGKTTEKEWHDLIGSNMMAPFFLTQAAAPHLRASKGSIVNIVDIHADRPLKEHPVYCAAKAGLVMLTKSMARELGPDIRVNAVAPGAIMWPSQKLDDITKQRIISRTALKRQGNAENVAKAVLYLIKDATYTSGDIIKVDGGRSLND